MATYPKIAEVDAILARRRDLHVRVVEVHPEVSFAAWNGSPMMVSKHKRLARAKSRSRYQMPAIAAARAPPPH